MSNTIAGILHKKLPVKVVSDKLSIQEIWIKTEGQYPQYISVQAKNDKIDSLNSVNVGDAITAHINIDGRLWTGPDGVEKCFNSLSLWKVEVNGRTNAVPGVDSGTVVPNDDSDLPF